MSICRKQRIHLASKAVISNAKQHAAVIAATGTSLPAQRVSKGDDSTLPGVRRQCTGIGLTAATAAVLLNVKRNATTATDAGNVFVADEGNASTGSPSGSMGGATSNGTSDSWQTTEQHGSDSDVAYTPPPEQGSRPRARPRPDAWDPEHVKVMVQYIKSLRPGEPAKAGIILKRLGLPDGRALAKRVRTKLVALRHFLLHGQDPSAGKCTAPVAKSTYQWREWLTKAFKALPGHTGTGEDLAAVLEADPEIAPKLDRRPNPKYVTLPRWRASILVYISKYPEFVKTGRKRGRYMEYRYDEKPASKKRKRG